MKPWDEETRWQPLGKVVARLKREVEEAYYEGDEESASYAHDDLTRAEWRLRKAERKMG